jgi:cyclopropane-fatty-acyl-phospholipid synthase
MMIAERLLEKELIPDSLVRFQIRRLLKRRISDEKMSDKASFVELMRTAPVAVETRAANDQHYEVPAKFFEHTLGKRLKYSCAYFDTGRENLDDAELAMLELTCGRAELRDGQDVLELGCGWGSLSLFMAEKYPNSRIVGVSNSSSQREFIFAKAAERGLKNLQIITCDMNQFCPDNKFDRVVSVEMFEHMRNVEELLKRIDSWLKDDGKLFVHIFTHREFAYLFEDKDASDWMARHFFTGGMMPSHDLYSRLSSGLEIEQNWVVPGIHYGRTSELWLENMDRHESEIRQIFSETYGEDQVSRWWARWRVFFMACAELWNFRGGSEWQVSHYRFRKART